LHAGDVYAVAAVVLGGGVEHFFFGGSAQCNAPMSTETPSERQRDLEYGARYTNVDEFWASLWRKLERSPRGSQTRTNLLTTSQLAVGLDRAMANALATAMHSAELPEITREWRLRGGALYRAQEEGRDPFFVQGEVLARDELEKLYPEKAKEQQ